MEFLYFFYSLPFSNLIRVCSADIVCFPWDVTVTGTPLYRISSYKFVCTGCPRFSVRHRTNYVYIHLYICTTTLYVQSVYVRETVPFCYFYFVAPFSCHAAILFSLFLQFRFIYFFQSTELNPMLLLLIVGTIKSCFCALHKIYRFVLSYICYAQGGTIYLYRYIPYRGGTIVMHANCKNTQCRSHVTLLCKQIQVLCIDGKTIELDFVEQNQTNGYKMKEVGIVIFILHKR